ncbi:MAG: FtsQ-type POTRA domain-containing protein [Verrucomicrobia bacterium]|nr:FtsQ-type POTRA domain-containing protein [Verrucomicrobiota bacterium]
MGPQPQRSHFMKWTGMIRKKTRNRGRKTRHVLHARLSAKGQAREFSRRVGIFLCLAGSLATAALVTSVGMDVILGKLLYSNPDFTLRRFQVEQQGKMGKGELVAASGVRIGQNLLRIDLEDVKQSIQRLPNIASVRVERRLPDTLFLAVEERRPVALICPTPSAGTQLAQSTYYIDARGFVLKPKPGEKLMSLPIIRGISADEVVEGERTNNADLKSALLFLKVAPLAPVRDGLDCSVILVEGPGRFLISTPRGGKIRFRSGYLEEQLDRLGVIFDYAESKGRIVHTVDLTPERNVPVTFTN